MLKKVNKKILPVIIGATFFAALIINFYNSLTIEQLSAYAGRKLHKKENLANAWLDTLNKKLNGLSPSDLLKHHISGISELFNEEKIALFIYEKDTLKY